MKKALLSMFLLINASIAYCQPTAGLIAHWDMDSSTNDVTGGGHNGHGNNLTAAAGEDGIVGHAWYFNGVNSSITIPYLPDMNVGTFTISAKLKVQGFYAGTCHGNTVFARGSTAASTGMYYLIFNDGPAGFGCSGTLDTTKEAFFSDACGASATVLGPSPFTPYDYTPHVQENMWYTVVSTFNDSAFKLYVNNVLMSDVPSTHPGMSTGTSTDSASIGYCIYSGSTGYPYGFHGIIDDIRLYNRALSSCEVAKLTFNINNLIVTNPINDTCLPGGTGHFTITDTGGGTPGYQWQENRGTGFTNLSNTSPYSGVTTKTLTVNPVTGTMSGYQYRCVRGNVDMANSCMDTSAQAILTVNTTGISTEEIRNGIVISPNPTHGVITVSAPVSIERIEVINYIGQTVFTKSNNTGFLELDLNCLKPGVYTLKINNAFSKRLIKN